MGLVFKRRDKRGVLKVVADSFWPKGGWARASSYVMHRLRRLPDPPARIARGIAAGVFVSFSPLFGLHFIYAAIIAFFLRGNILAALLSTFVGNPLTFPIMGAISLELGTRMLGRGDTFPLSLLGSAFSRASGELWANFKAMFTEDEARWGYLKLFFDDIFWPYFVGGLAPGVIAGLVAYALTRPVIEAYQRRRTAQRRKKAAAKRARAADQT